ncbi:MAG: hypothetical protein ACPKPY_09810 [Nitrososphaeraceae archaeon]
MTLKVNDFPIFTESSLIERIKQELSIIPLNKEKYLEKVREQKKNRPSNQYYYDYDLELDFSIPLDDPYSIQCKLIDDRKYYYKAYFYQKIGLFLREDIPVFKVYLSDLSTEVIASLFHMEHDDIKHVMKQAVGRIFEDINFKLYHDSISSRLEVVLVD